MARRSVHSHSFSEVPRAEIQRSSFDRSHGYKTTFDAGRLIPFFVDEALPGDTFNVRVNGFCRMATPIFPIMDNMYMDTHFFAVPNRLVWDNWQKFMGEIENPQTTQPGEIEYLIPQATLPNPTDPIPENSIADYMGLPVGAQGVTASALFGRAYRLIWNEWFRDQNLQDPLPFSTDDGPDVIENFGTLTAVRGKRHDYFTSCLPWPQKGPDVTIGLAGYAPVISEGDGVPVFDTSITSGLGPSTIGMESGEGNRVMFDVVGSNAQPHDPFKWQDTALQADLTGGSAVTINALREAFQVQKLYERDARGGTRYTELIKAHFGVTSPDARLQRPEYLGGGTTPVIISPVQSTAETTTDAGTDGRVLGGLSAVGTVSVKGNGFTKSFTEHCIIIGLVSVRADQTYQQGIERQFSRKEKLDFYWPALAHLGEQEVLNKEIWWSNDKPIDDAVFGYQERYGEYRYKNSKITGLFRSDATQSLDAWHLSEDFDSLPTLSEAFIRHEPPVDRVIAIPSEPHFIGDFWFNFKAARPMPMFGVPGNVDRF